MPAHISRRSISSAFQSVSSVVKKGISPPPSISQTDLISEMTHQPKPQTVQKLQERTDKQVQIFIKRSSLFAQVKLLHKWSSYGVKTADDDRKFLLIVQDLTKEKSLGFFRSFFKIRSVMNRHFKHLSFFRMLFFYFTFTSWVPGLYIRRTVTKILGTSREELKKGKNLPDLGSKVLRVANSYLANYNNAVSRFRDDDTSLIGDRDDFLKLALKHPSIIGFDNEKTLYSEFAKAASHDKIRPDFSPLSKTIRKVQLLDFQILKRIPTPLKIIPQLITYTLGVLPFIIAKILEVPPNLIIKIFHRRTIASFVPSVLEDTLKAVNRSGFTHAINCFLCDIISDVLEEMKKGPYDKDTTEPPQIVEKPLSADIKKFSEFLFTLLTREPYKTKDELRRITANGIDPASAIERVLKLRYPLYLDRVWIKYFFVDKGLHPNIIELFNFLFGQPEKFEEYLCNLMELLNKIYDDVPDIDTPEGRALLAEQQEKREKREALVDQLIEEGITTATDDGIHEFFEELSLHQRKELIFSYRKIKEKAFERIPTIEQDAKSIQLACKDLLVSFSPVSSKTQAKEDIELARKDLKDLFTVIQNAIPKENGPIKKAMERHLKEFKETEGVLSDSLIQIDRLHDQIEQLKKIKQETENLRKALATKPLNFEIIQLHLQNLKNLKKGTEFDVLIDEYDFLSNQFNKIQTHETFISSLTQVLKNSFFKDGLLLAFAKAQKDYLNHPNSTNKERKFKMLHHKMLAMLSELESIGDETDIHQMKEVIRKISICPKPEQIKVVYERAKKLFEQKLLKHDSLLEDERKVVPTKYFSKCRAVIHKHQSSFANLFTQKHHDLMSHSQSFYDSIQTLKIILRDFDKKKPRKVSFDRSTMVKALASAGTLAASYVKGSLPLLGVSVATAASVVFKPLSFIAAHSGVPLAKRAAVPLAQVSADNAYGVITNSAFYEGLIHAYMKDFIDYVKRPTN